MARMTSAMLRELAAANDRLEKLFEANVRRYKSAGEWTIKCRKGLWAVYGSDRARVEQEARSYFIQYLEDGEYE